MKSDFNVPKVYALVNKANIDCLKLIHHPQYPLFEEIDNTGFKDKDHPGESPRVFVLNLATMNFIHELVYNMNSSFILFSPLIRTSKSIDVNSFVPTFLT